MVEYVSALRIEPAHRAAVTSVAFTRLPDGSAVIASAGDKVIRLWDADTDDTLEVFRGHRGPVRCMAFHTLPNERVLLASGCEDGTVRLWDVETASSVAKLRADGPVWSVAMGTLPDGRTLLAAGVEDGPILLWDANDSGARPEKLLKHTRSVNALTFGHMTDGDAFLASGSDDNTIKLWPLATGVPSDLTGHTGHVTSLAFHRLPNGKPVLVSGSTDGTVRRWSPDEGKQMDNDLTSGGDPVWSVALGGDVNGRVLLASGSDSTVRLWDVVTGTPVGDPFGDDHHQPILAVEFSPRADGVLVTGGRDGTVRRWEYAVGRQLSEPLIGHSSPVRAITAGTSTIDDAMVFASCGDDGAVRVWEVREGECQATSLAGHRSAARALTSFTESDGHLWFVSGDDDGTVLVQDAVGTRHPDVPPIGHGSAVLALGCVVTPDGPVVVASGHQDGSVRVWTVGGDTAPALDRHPEAVRSLAFAHREDGSLVLATGSANGIVRLWDPFAGGEATMQFNGQTSVWSVALLALPDNGLLLASGGDNSIRIWEVGRTSRPLPERLNGHSRPVRSVTFATDSDGNALLISGSDDGTVRIWDPIGRSRLDDILKGHEGPILTVSAVRPAAGHARILSGGEDGVVQVWEPVGSANVPPILQAGLRRNESPASGRTNALAARDDTATDDLLGRSILAGHLATVLKDVAVDRKVKDNSRGTAVIHIDGRWGAGKTTLVTLLLEQLRAGPNPSDEARPSPLADAIVVDYDAWRESAVAPEWWSLATTLNRAVRGARAGVTRAVMSVLGMTTRVMSSRPVLVAVALLAAVVIARLLGAWREMSEVSGVVAALTAVTAVGLSAGRVLFWTSSAFGKLYVKSDENPLGNIAKIIDRLRRWTPRQGRAHRIADTLAGLGGFVALILTARLMLQSETSRSSAATVKDWVLDRWVLLVLVLLAIAIVSTSWHRRFNPATKSGDDHDPATSGQRNQKALTGNLTQALRRREWLSAIAKVAAAIASCALVWTAWGVPLPVWVLEHPVNSAILLMSVVIAAHAAWTWAGVTRNRRPIILVIDDLDRCTADRAVKLLETIHTLLRPRTPTRLLRRWRAPAPLIVLVLADGRWIRVAFESAYPTFSSLGSDVHDLGADFLQKLFDHTVLVPTMADEQIKALVHDLTEAKNDPVPHASEHARKDALQLIHRRDPGELRSRDTNIKLFREPLARKDAIEVERRRVEKEASPTAMARNLNHLLTTYSSLMPPNPRLIKRVANTWSMLLAMQSHLNAGRWRMLPPEDLLVRAAIMFVRFPTLVDELLSCATPPSTDGTGNSGAASTAWQRPDVQELLTTDRGIRISPEDIARCYGRAFPATNSRHTWE